MLLSKSNALKSLFIACVALVLSFGASAQIVESDERAILSVDEGINFSKDSLFLMNLRIMMHNSAGLKTV